MKAVATQHLLAQPHHDGSALYVSNLTPALGDTVSVLVRVPHEADVTAVHVRFLADAEPIFVAAVPDRTTETETWWSAKVTLHNPVTSYRFILEGGPTGYAWLNGVGTHLRDIPDAADFRLVAFTAPPAWAADAVVYQVFPDRFAKSLERPTPDWAHPARWTDPVRLGSDEIARQLYGGDLDGVASRLDHIQRLGASVVYLTPFFPARSNHRYDASTFDEVDPVLGGHQALARLVDAAHARGIRVLGDFTTNHTGSSHEWFEKALAVPGSDERGFYLWEGQEYACWLGVPTLPKLNYDSQELRRRVFEDPDGVVRRWISGERGLDGWRVDVANMTGRYKAQDHNHAVARAMRQAMEQVGTDKLLVGEHGHDFSQDAAGDGWHGVMNYAGFTRPVWTWLRDRGHAPTFLGSPLTVPRLGGEAVMDTMREFAAFVPWRTVQHSFNLVGSHDTTRIRSLVGDDPRHVEVAVGLLMTLPGIPMVTYGDEIGMRGDFGEDGRRPMPWDESQWDAHLFDVYRSLIGVRSRSHALRHGGLRWVHAGDDALVYLREGPEQTALVHCARSAHAPVALPTRHLRGIERAETLYGRTLHLRGDSVTVVAARPEVNVWAWQTPYPDRTITREGPQ